MFFGLLRDHDEMYDEEYLKPLRSYKYRGVDKSPISNYILRPYWNAVTLLFPMWMAPNLITLLGFVLMILALALVIIFCPDLATPLPSYFYYIFVFCIWTYSTFDNCDGKQARRTGTSSPLGELFDHGCDALNCWVVGLVELASVALGTDWLASLFMLIVFWGFYLPTWETYHTGVLYLGYVNGPTEGVILGCVLVLLSAIYGPQIYHEPISKSLPLIPWPAWMAEYSLQAVAGTAAIGSCLFILIPSSLWSVWLECRERKRSFLKALSELSFMGFVSLAAYAWLWSPYTRARQDHFILFHMAVGLAFGKMATKIILAHLTKQPFPYFSGLMLPLFIGAVLFNAIPIFKPDFDLALLARLETTYLWAFLVAALIGYANWIYHVIGSFCHFLDINCLTIKKRHVSPVKQQPMPSTPQNMSTPTRKDDSSPATSPATALINRRLAALRNGKRATSSPYRA